MDKKVDVRNRYSQELSKISYILQCLEKGRYYEKTGAKCDGYLANNIIELREKLNDLIDKIEYSEKSTSEILAETMKEYPI